jgi:hypothetical protein
MGAIWGVAWSAAAAVLARVPGFSTDLPLAFLFAPLGFISGVAFSGVLVAIESRGRFARLSVPRFAGWGALSGLLLSGIFVAAAALRGASPWAEFLLFGPALIVAGSACAAGTVALARRAEQRALPEHDEPGRIGRGG